jgi:hypothetical protein
MTNSNNKTEITNVTHDEINSGRLAAKFVVSALCSISNWVHTKTNEIHGWGSAILDILLKIPGLKTAISSDNIINHILYK